MPEIGRGFQEFDSDLGFARRRRAKTGHLADLLFACRAVDQPKLLTFFHFSGQQNERAVRIHNQSIRFFFKPGFLGSFFDAYGYRQSNNHTLASPARGI